ncbi:MAG: hypothetical protein ICV55_15500 [Coleofasciculus sp. C3-bin4]|nr:hypothetical protein [Coleofasciculus sp. C3-bin4]
MESKHSDFYRKVIVQMLRPYNISVPRYYTSFTETAESVSCCHSQAIASCHKIRIAAAFRQSQLPSLTEVIQQG